MKEQSQFLIWLRVASIKVVSYILMSSTWGSLGFLQDLFVLEQPLTPPASNNRKAAFQIALYCE